MKQFVKNLVFAFFAIAIVTVQSVHARVITKRDLQGNGPSFNNQNSQDLLAAALAKLDNNTGSVVLAPSADAATLQNTLSGLAGNLTTVFVVARYTAASSDLELGTSVINNCINTLGTIVQSSSINDAVLTQINNQTVPLILNGIHGMLVNRAANGAVYSVLVALLQNLNSCVSTLVGSQQNSSYACVVAFEILGVNPSLVSELVAIAPVAGVLMVSSQDLINAVYTTQNIVNSAVALTIKQAAVMGLVQNIAMYTQQLSQLLVA